MKKSFTIVLLCVILFNCDNDDNQINDRFFNGKWNLTKIINTSLGGSTSPDINDTHFYQINNDGTFKRISLKNDISDELVGTYIVTAESSFYGNENNVIQKFIELSYSSDANFFNCGIIETNKQLLILNSNNKLQNTLSGACDGYNYEYTKEN